MIPPISTRCHTIAESPSPRAVAKTSNGTLPIFPNEIWMQIFESCSSIKDMHTLSLINKAFLEFFYQLLHHWFRPHQPCHGREIVQFLNSANSKDILCIHENNQDLDYSDYLDFIPFDQLIHQAFSQWTLPGSDLLSAANLLLDYAAQKLLRIQIPYSERTLQNLIDCRLFDSKQLIEIQPIRLKDSTLCETLTLSPEMSLDQVQWECMMSIMPACLAQRQPFDIVSFMRIPSEMLWGGLIGACELADSRESDAKAGCEIAELMLKSNLRKITNQTLFYGDKRHPLFWAAENNKREWLEKFIHAGITASEKDIAKKIYKIIKNKPTNYNINAIDVSDLMNIKVYIGKVEGRIGNDENIPDKMNKLLHIIENPNIGIVKGYVDVGFEGAPIYYKEER